MTEKEKINKVLKSFEFIQQRPAMYFSRDSDVFGAVQFFIGFHHAFAVLGYPFPSKAVFDTIISERGWKQKAVGYWFDMKEKGLSDEEIVKELVLVEIEAWKKLLETLN